MILIALPIKVYAFATMNKQGWLTRHADQIGGDGQDARTLTPGAVRHETHQAGRCSSSSPPCSSRGPAR